MSWPHTTLIQITVCVMVAQFASSALASATSSTSSTCFCVQDPQTENLYRSCSEVMPGNRSQAIIYCRIKNRSQKVKVLKGWRRLPADDVACKPCEGEPDPGDTARRRPEEVIDK